MTQLASYLISILCFAVQPFLEQQSKVRASICSDIDDQLELGGCREDVVLLDGVGAAVCVDGRWNGKARVQFSGLRDLVVDALLRKRRRVVVFIGDLDLDLDDMEERLRLNDDVELGDTVD